MNLVVCLCFSLTTLALTNYIQPQGVPLMTQSDAGSENNGVANSQTTIRQTVDPSLNGTLQHKWMPKLMNIKSEGNWSLLRRDFTPGFENLLDQGVNNGWYDSNNTLEKWVK